MNAEIISTLVLRSMEAGILGLSGILMFKLILFKGGQLSEERIVRESVAKEQPEQVGWMSRCMKSWPLLKLEMLKGEGCKRASGAPRKEKELVKLVPYSFSEQKRSLLNQVVSKRAA